MKENIKRDINSRKIVIIVILVIFLLGLLFGSIYITILDNDNKNLIIDSVKNYFINNKNLSFSNKLEIFKTKFLSNSIYFILIWILGLSIIGIPIVFIMIFFKGFVTGFTIGSIFACYKFKGLIYIFIYIIPSNLLLILLSIFLSIYSSNISIKLSMNVFTKKSLNFGTFMGRYFFILLVTVLIIIFTSIFEAFISPIFYNML